MHVLSHGANVRPPFVTAKNATQDTWMARPRYRSSGHCKAEMTRSFLVLGESDRSRAFSFSFHPGTVP